jgi:GAF domain-containing protein
MSGRTAEGDTESTIARLEAEVEALRLRLEQGAAASSVSEALAVAVVAEEISAPATHSRLLELVLETAATAISARAGSIFVIDPDAGELACEAAIGGRAEEVMKIRIPLGHGIAGGVALSGLPLAVSHASADKRWAKDIGERVGYVPESIACVPLFYEDRLIGALELLDKQGAESFTPADLHLLGLFGHQAAITIRHSRAKLSASALLAGAFGGEEEEDTPPEELRRFGDALELDPTFRGSLELAHLVRDIAQAGERELAACRELLSAFAEYVRSRPR